MSILEFGYELEITFSVPVKDHRFMLRCLPLSDTSQLAGDVRVEVAPHSSLWRSAAVGERGTLMGSVHFEHERFKVSVNGHAAQTQGGDTEEPHPMYTAFSSLTEPCERILGLAREFEGRADVATAEEVMKRVHGLIEYTPGLTDSTASAAKATELGGGVCQDYAHIFCSAMRLLGVPTRYVAGIGSVPGETHAWNECFIGGRWLGFDATGCVALPSGYVKFAVGPDAPSCALNRGVFTPARADRALTQTQRINAYVREL